MNLVNVVGGLVLVLVNVLSLASLTVLCSDPKETERTAKRAGMADTLIRTPSRRAYGYALKFTSIAILVGAIGIVANLFPPTRVFASFVFPLTYSILSLVVGAVGTSYASKTWNALSDVTCRTHSGVALRTTGSLALIGCVMVFAGAKGY